MSHSSGLRGFGDSSASRRKVSRAALECGILVAVLAILLVLPHIDALPCKSNRGVLPLTFGRVHNGIVNGTATSNDCDYWNLPQFAIDNDASCSVDASGNTSCLFFEFWRLNKTGGVEGKSTQLVLFVVSYGKQPDTGGNWQVYMRDQQPAILPNPVKYLELGENGSYVDSVAVSNGRAHQRFLVPLNANKSGELQGWYVTVANLEVQTPAPYTFRVSCVAASQPAPCPRPGPDLPECGGRGTCGDPPEGALDDGRLRPALNRVCYCDPGWGDVDCRTPAPRLAASGDVVSSVVLAPGEWAYWQLSLPAPASKAAAAKPALLVEMNRAGGGFDYTGDLYGTWYDFGGGGDPMLFLMPKRPYDANRVPFLNDFLEYADTTSTRLLQNLHFVVARDLGFVETLPAEPPGGSNSTTTLEYYVAVYNNPDSDRFPGGQPLLNNVTNVTIRARWKTTAAGGGGALCPSNCYGRGNCSDPYDTSATSMMLAPGPIPATTEWLCTCQKGYGGPLCEGTLYNYNLSIYGTSGGLISGGWLFTVITFDPSRPEDFSLDLELLVYGMASTDRPSTNYTLFITVHLMVFPPVPLPLPLPPATNDTYRRGVVEYLSYNVIFGVGGRRKPLRVSGQKLKPGYSYVFGLYNSDYVQKVAQMPPPPWSVPSGGADAPPAPRSAPPHYRHLPLVRLHRHPG